MTCNNVAGHGMYTGAIRIAARIERKKVIQTDTLQAGQQQHSDVPPHPGGQLRAVAVVG